MRTRFGATNIFLSDYRMYCISVQFLNRAPKVRIPNFEPPVAMHASQADGRQFDVCRGISNFVCKSLTCQTVTSLVFFLFLTLYNFFHFFIQFAYFSIFSQKENLLSRPQDAPWKVLLLWKLSKLMKTYIAKFYETLRFLSLK